MRRHKLPLVIGYAAILITALVVLSQGMDSPLMLRMRREAREVRASLVQGGRKAESQLRLIRAHTLQAERPETPKDI